MRFKKRFYAAFDLNRVRVILPEKVSGSQKDQNFETYLYLYGDIFKYCTL